MSRINNNVSALISQRILSQQNTNLSGTLERLSTGLRINRGSDGPAGLIASERLRADKRGISSAIANAERANQIANIAEGGLQEISSMLIEVQGLVVEAANESGLSTEEKEANQLQIDNILQTIDRIAATTSFGSTKLLNGGLDFRVTSVATTVADFTINGAKIGEGQTSAVSMLVTGSAQHAALFLSTNGALDLTDATSQFTFELGGAEGTRQFSFSSGTTMATIATSVNAFKDITGVSAITQGTGLMFKSTEFGSAESVSFDITSLGGLGGGAAVHQVSSIDEDVVSTTAANITAVSSVNSPIRDTGQDIAAVINGVVASGKGKVASVNTDALDANIELTTAGAQAVATIAALTIQDSGARFSIGSTVDLTSQVRIGLADVAARKLGSASVGFLNTLGAGAVNNLVDGNIENGQKVVSEAISKVSSLRGRIGTFQSGTLRSQINSLNIALENTSAAESMIRDTDFAVDTAQLTRSQILVQAATSILAIAGARSQSALQLLS
jgi:flagellin